MRRPRSPWPPALCPCGTAQATRLGEALVLGSATCAGQPGVGYVIRATNDELDVAIVYDGGPDPTDPTYDFAGPSRVELYRGAPGGSIGDGEGYVARPDLDAATIEGVTGSESGAAGTVSLDPDDATRAPQIHPDGGELTFDITC